MVGDKVRITITIDTDDLQEPVKVNKTQGNTIMPPEAKDVVNDIKEQIEGNTEAQTILREWLYGAE